MMPAPLTSIAVTIRIVMMTDASCNFVRRSIEERAEVGRVAGMFGCDVNGPGFIAPSRDEAPADKSKWAARLVTG